MNDLADPISNGLVRDAALKLSPLGERLEAIEHAIVATREQGGEVWECGANLGGTALFMRACISGDNRAMRAFDTFEGLPWQGENDAYRVGEMKADRAQCAALFSGLTNCHVYKGVMPDSFSGLENSTISVAHIDVDQQRSVREVLEWVYPRVHVGGWIIIDDYNDRNCPGAKISVDEFLKGRTERLSAPGGPNPQAYFVKTPN